MIPGLHRMAGMSSRKHHALTGGFIILGGAAFIGMTLWLAFGDITKDYKTYLAYMEESVSGLYADAPVKFRGVEVGRVSALELDVDNPQRIKITLAIDPRVRITGDTVATLAFQGLTGIASIDLSGGTSGAPELRARDGQRYPVIRTGPSLFVRFDTVITELIGNLNRVARDLHSLMSASNRAHTEQFLANLETLTGSLADRRQTLEQSIADLSHMLARGAEASDAMPGLMANIDRTSVSVTRMAEDILETSQVLRTGVQETSRNMQVLSARTLPEFESLVSEIRQLVASLQEISRSLEDDPRRILYGRALEAPGPGE